MVSLCPNVLRCCLSCCTRLLSMETTVNGSLFPLQFPPPLEILGAVCRSTPDISFLWAAQGLKRGRLYLPEGYRSACWEAGWCSRSAPGLPSSPAQTLCPLCPGPWGHSLSDAFSPAPCVRPSLPLPQVQGLCSRHPGLAKPVESPKQGLRSLPSHM